MTDKEHKGVLDQISDFGKKAMSSIKEGFGYFHHPDKENLAPKDSNLPVEPSLEEDKKRPGTYEGIVGSVDVDEKLDPYEHSAKEHPL